jgi:DNA repair exonuclease SbcCD ATPase subunit
MNSAEIISLVAGLLQFGVAGYSLRLNRLFGTARVGWSLFWAFFLMALLHLTQTAMPGVAGAQLGGKVDVMYALISLLLLTSMVHLETVLKERARVEREERRMRAELESEVKKKTAYLMRAIEELQAEIDARKRAEAEVETTHWELRTVSRKAESAQIAASVLRSVGNMLKSVNISANLVSNQMKKSKIANVAHVGALIRDHAADFGKFMTNDPMGRKLPVYIAQLGEHLDGEQAILSTELESLKRNLEHIRQILVMHQKCTSLGNSIDTTRDTHLINGVQHTSMVVAA